MPMPMPESGGPPAIQLRTGRPVLADLNYGPRPYQGRALIGREFAKARPAPVRSGRER
jgi:hypothetical protein